MRSRLYKILTIAILILLPCRSFAQGADIILSQVVHGLLSPVFMTAPKNDSRIFIVQQVGLITVIDDDKFYDILDIRNQTEFWNEAGLLGMALHPGFLENGIFYVSYIDKSINSIIEEYRIRPNALEADRSSARIIYSLSQPAKNHNGGMIAFGPDGFLYAGFGDGGGAFDVFENGQNFDTALGSIIRIEVGPGAPEPYGIPNSNPNPQGIAPEVWTYGLRNPWRFSIDGNLIYIGDVGQDNHEEINILNIKSSGENLGWPIAEGNECRTDDCDSASLTWPVVTYPHMDGCSVTGGYVYRGVVFPELQGHYFYGDFCSGEVFSFLNIDGSISLRRSWSDVFGNVDALSSFGVDGFGELYLVTLDGTIFKMERK